MTNEELIAEILDHLRAIESHVREAIGEIQQQNGGDPWGDDTSLPDDLSNQDQLEGVVIAVEKCTALTSARASLAAGICGRLNVRRVMTKG